MPDIQDSGSNDNTMPSMWVRGERPILTYHGWMQDAQHMYAGRPAHVCVGRGERLIEDREDVPDSPRRQWGAERSATPLSIMHERPSASTIAVNYAAIVVTVVSWAIYMVSTVLSQLVDNAHPTFRTTVETVMYITIVTLLSLSALIYLLTRKGALMRFRTHRRVPRALLDEHFDDRQTEESITVLIPSYVEEPKVVEKTIWSAALQEFPDITIALLIDDPPFPSSSENRAILRSGREVVAHVVEELNPMAERFSQSRSRAREELADIDRPEFSDSVALAREGGAVGLICGWLRSLRRARARGRS